MNVMPLIREVYSKQDSRLMNMPNDLKKFTLSSLVFEYLIGEAEWFSGQIIDPFTKTKVLGIDVEIIQSNDIFISISAK